MGAAMSRERGFQSTDVVSLADQVRDVVTKAELARQRAKLYSRARVFIAVKYLGDQDPTVDFEAVASVLEELLVAADAEAQQAQRLLAQVVVPDAGRCPNVSPARVGQGKPRPKRARRTPALANPPSEPERSR
jgi:hypothetical protein